MFNIERDPFPYDDGSFSLVVCCEILEHLAMDPSHTLKEIHRVLKPGGYVFISTPNVLCAGNTWRLLRGDNIYQAYSGYGIYGRHSREYTPGELEKILREHRFEANVYVEDAYPRGLCHRLLTRYGRLRNRRDNLFAIGKAYGETVQRYPSWLYSQQWGRGRKKFLADSIVMGDDEALQLGPGWHQLESGPPPFRWTGREAVVFLTAAKAHTVLRIIAHAGPRGATGRISINGAEPQAFGIGPGGPRYISAELPNAISADPARSIELKLYIDNPFVPSRNGSSPDDRELGIVVESVLLS